MYTIKITDEDGKVVEEVTATEAPVIMVTSKFHEGKMKIIDRDNPTLYSECVIEKSVIHGVILFRQCELE